MANGRTLPPQAYTREILTSAFNWLQSQPESVRKLATTPDALVGLYLRAQRFGDSSLEADAPVSSQAFISDLKNLAEGLKQFEAPPEMREARATKGFSTSRVIKNGMPPSATLAASPAATSTTMATLAPPARSVISESLSELFKPASNPPAKNIFGSPTQSHAFNPVMSSAPPTVAPAPASAMTTAGSSGSTTVTSVSMTSMTSTSSSLPTPANSQFSGSLNSKTLELIREVKGKLNLSTDAEAINMMISIAYKNLKDLLG